MKIVAIVVLFFAVFVSAMFGFIRMEYWRDGRLQSNCSKRWEGRTTRYVAQNGIGCQVQDQFGMWVPESNFIVRSE